MTRSTSKRKYAVAQVLSSMAREVWMMQDTALAEMTTQLLNIAETGQALPAVESRTPMHYIQAATGAGRTAVISVTGVIRQANDAVDRYMGGTSLTDLVREYVSAMNDKDVTDIRIDYNTPGGSAQGLADASAIMKSFKGQKPVVAVVDGLCASAGYYLAVNADKIVSKRDSLIGSIGTKVLDYSMVRMYGEMGIDVNEVHFGENKVAGSPMSPMSPEREAALQEMVTDFGNDFVDHVALSRGISHQVVRSQYGDGKVFKATTALKIGMIDSVLDPIAGGLSASAQQPLRQASNQNNSSASVSIGSTVSSPISEAIHTTESYEMKISARLKSALFATGFIGKLEASDDVCEASLTAFYKAKGHAMPAAEEEVLQGLAASMCGTAALPIQPAAASGVSEHAEAVSPAMTLEMYKDRRNQLNSVASLINAQRDTPLITSEMISAALDSKNGIDAVQSQWKEQVSAALPKTHVSYVAASEDKLAKLSIDAIVGQSGVSQSNKPKPNEFSGKSVMQVAKACLASAGVKGLDDASPQDIAEAALGFGHHSGLLASSQSAYNTPADFPNIMSEASKIIMEDAAMAAKTSFEVWAHRLPDADNMDTESIAGHGTIDGLDAQVDGDNVKDRKLFEESKGFIVPVHYANDIALTWLMMIKSISFQAFLSSLGELGSAGKKVLNRQLISFLTGNVELIDGVALFHDATHGNLITTGGGTPSNAQLKLMAKKHSAQRPPGATANSGADPSILLVPDGLKRDAAEAFKTLIVVNGMSVANLESNQSYFKDNIMVVSDAELDLVSAVEYYSLVAPNMQGLRSFVYRYLAGYGETGRRIEYVDNQKRARVYGVDFVAGSAVTKHRGVVKNPGA